MRNGWLVWTASSCTLRLLLLLLLRSGPGVYIYIIASIVRLRGSSRLQAHCSILTQAERVEISLILAFVRRCRYRTLRPSDLCTTQCTRTWSLSHAIHCIRFFFPFVSCPSAQNRSCPPQAQTKGTAPGGLTPVASFPAEQSPHTARDRLLHVAEGAAVHAAVRAPLCTVYCALCTPTTCFPDKVPNIPWPPHIPSPNLRERRSLPSLHPWTIKT